MTRAVRYFSALAVTLVGAPLLAGSAQAKTDTGSGGGPASTSPGIVAIPFTTPAWHLLAVAVTASLLTFAAVLVVQWVRANHHRRVPRPV